MNFYWFSCQKPAPVTSQISNFQPMQSNGDVLQLEQTFQIRLNAFWFVRQDINQIQVIGNQIFSKTQFASLNMALSLGKTYTVVRYGPYDGAYDIIYHI